MIPNKEKKKMALSCITVFALLNEITSKIRVIFVAWMIFILLEKKMNLNLIKKYVILWNCNIIRKGWYIRI